MTRSNGAVTTYGYDTQGRLTTVSAGTGSYSYVYDTCVNGKTLLCEANSTTASTRYEYEPSGLLRNRRDITLANGVQTDFWTRFYYDNLGRLNAITYPSGIAVGYGYTKGELKTMTVNIGGVVSNVITGTAYRSMGPIESMGTGNALSRNYTYDNDGRLTGVNTKNGAAFVQNLSYAYNNIDLITGITNGVDASLSQSYAYDKESRLTNNSGQTVTYDQNGNRASYTIPTSGDVAGWTDGYSVDANSNRLAGITGFQARTFYHDALGNMTGSNGGVTYTYDTFNRMASSTRDGVTANYLYNSRNERVWKASAAYGAQRFVYGPNGQLLAERRESDAAWTHYLWFNGVLVGLVRSNQLYHINSDHLGRPESVTNSAKAVVWRARNTGFDRMVLVNSFGGLDVGFPGQYWDQESALWYNINRYYDAKLGRYTQSDPLGLASGLNTYAYVGGNPVSYVDPLGLQDRFGGFKPPAPPPRFPVGVVREILYRHANEMQAKNWVGADKFYHCMAMCEAAGLGEEEAAIAGMAGEARELNQHYRHGDSKEECDADRAANAVGLKAGLSGQVCTTACGGYRPPGMPYP